MTDRRFWFFLAAASGILVPATPGELRWVPQVLVIVYVGLAALVALESFSRRDSDGRPPWKH
ncbi:MAG TPA: hypothetical protein VHH09_00225 [Acidimicrobiales bacterium]|nr:hypothetical protein [Acidimicrobiales bacterium]